MKPDDLSLWEATRQLALLLTIRYRVFACLFDLCLGPLFIAATFILEEWERTQEGQRGWNPPIGHDP